MAVAEPTAIQYRATKEGKVYQTHLKHKVVEPPSSEDTLSKTFLKNVQRYGDEIAMRKKRMGIWQEYTWQDVYEHVTNFCMGMLSLGLQADETVIIIGDNDPEFYWSQIAIHAVRSRTCGVFSDATAPELEFAINATNATFIIAHDQEQVDKALELREKLPQIRKVIYWEPRGLWGYEDEWLLDFNEVEALGKEYKKSHEGLFEQLVAETQSQDVIILSMTSGTTSLPKFAMITHYQLVYGNALNFNYIPTYQADNWLSFSPMAWLSEQAFGFSPHLINAMKVNFPESAETVQMDMREIAPAGILFPSRVWENLAGLVRFRLQDSTWFNKALFGLFMPIAYKVIDLEDKRQSIPPHLQFARWLAEFAILEPLRDKIGLTKARNVLTAGAALSPDVIRFFRALGIELRQLYASTETFCTIHVPGDVRLGSVGVIVPGVEIKLAEDQEILVRTKARFAGYYNSPDKTAEAIDEEGWYHTGDAGYMDEEHGHLIYLDRMKDMIMLANGERFSPQYIEGRLKFSPYVQDIMTVGGEDKEFVSAIVIIDFENVARWAEKQGISFTTFVDLSQRKEIYDLIQKDVVEVNQTLPPAGRIHKFVILHKEFDADEAELTRTRKLRRGVLAEKYGDILDAMYNNLKDITVRAEVKYRDGRTGTIETNLNVATVIP